MKASVIVPAYNAENHLRSCLEALASQDFPKADFEVLVVDDGSGDSTSEVAKSFGARVLRQSNQGPARARNFGAQQAKNEIVVFTDTDCVPTPTWLSEMVKPFSDPEVVGVQGAYRTKQKSLVARFTQVEIEYRYRKMLSSQKLDWIGSYSAAYRKEIFLKEQGFSRDFTQASGEDPELSYKLSKKGLRLVFNPNAVVFHRHPENLSVYLGKKFRHAYWRVLLYQKHQDKALKDSYTPQAMKLQLAFFLLLPLFLLLALAVPGAWLVFLAALLLTALTFLPFFLFALGRDPVVGLVSPFIVLLRNLVFLAGLGKGLFLQPPGESQNH